jgi:SWI/SNF related-matrix-associated actin-dependent regulator of chromatin subfamily C
VAFLASAVGPGVAAAAAQRALGELTDGLKAGMKETEKVAADFEQVERTEKDRAEAEAAALKANEEAADEGMEVDGAEKTTDGQTATKLEDIATTEDKKDDIEMSNQAKETTGGSAEPESTLEEPVQEPTSNGLPRSHVQHVATLALGAAAAKASALAIHEERQLESLVTRLVSAQMKKLELKLGMFEKFEDMLEQEKRQLEIQKQHFFKDKLSLQSQLRTVQELLKKVQAGGNISQLSGEVARATQQAMPQSTAAGVKNVSMEGVEVPENGSIQSL